MPDTEQSQSSKDWDKANGLKQEADSRDKMKHIKNSDQFFLKNDKWNR